MGICFQLLSLVNVPPWNSHVSTFPSELMNDTFSPIFLSSGGTKGDLYQKNERKRQCRYLLNSS
nr:MAG TPA: hypothetical protein [Caudoviricetes sp.]